MAKPIDGRLAVRGKNVMTADFKLLRKRFALLLPSRLPQQTEGFYTLSIWNPANLDYGMQSLAAFLVISGGFVTVLLVAILNSANPVFRIICGALLLGGIMGHCTLLYLKWKRSRTLRVEIAPWPLESGKPFRVKLTMINKATVPPPINIECVVASVGRGGRTSIPFSKLIRREEFAPSPGVPGEWTAEKHIPADAPSSFIGNNFTIKWKLTATIKERFPKLLLSYTVPVVIPEVAQVINQADQHRPMRQSKQEQQTH